MKVFNVQPYHASFKGAVYFNDCRSGEEAIDALKKRHEDDPNFVVNNFHHNDLKTKGMLLSWGDEGLIINSSENYDARNAATRSIIASPTTLKIGTISKNIPI